MFRAGVIKLPKTKSGTVDEIELKAIQLPRPGTKVFEQLENVRFTKGRAQESAFVRDVHCLHESDIRFQSKQANAQLDAGACPESVFDSCETEAVLHNPEECGVTLEE